MSGAQLSHAEVGTEAGGFRFTGSVQGALRIVVWGYWPSDIVAAFTKEGPALSQKLVAASAFTLDATALKPQGAEGQDALRVLFRALGAVTFAKGTVLASNALTRMQLARLVRECGLDGRLSFDES